MIAQTENNVHNATTAPLYVETATLAKLLQCHPKTVGRLAARGLIPQPINLGGLRRWHLPSLLAALDK